MSKVFFDTNILVYAADRHDKKKQASSRNLIIESVVRGDGVVSTQVLQEFYVVATKKLGIDPLAAKDILTSFENLEVVQITTPLIHSAVDVTILNQLSFWDALIVVSAEHAHCEALLTEDLNHDQVIRGVRVQNPYL
jgi:predicted nucleic acid-binding protein